MPRAEEPSQISSIRTAQITSTDEIVSATPSRRASRAPSLAGSRAGSPSRAVSPSPSLDVITAASNRLALHGGNRVPRTWEEPADEEMEDARAQTPTPADVPSQPPNLTVSIPKGFAESLKIDVTTHERQRVYRDFGLEDIEDSLFCGPDIVKLAADCIAEWTYIKKSHPRNYVLGRFAITDRKEEWTLTKQANAWFGGGTEPAIYSTFRGDFLARAWWIDDEVKGSNKKIDTMFPEGHNKVEMRHIDDSAFLWFSPMGDCWPLPLTCGPDDRYDDIWAFTFKDPLQEQRGLTALATYLNQVCCGAFFAQ